MTAAELYELLFNAQEIQDRVFDLWITGSFAVVLACHFAREKITRLMYILISLLYLFYSLNLAIRWAYSGNSYLYFLELLTDMGETAAFEGGISPVFYAILVVSIFLGGTLGTVYYIWHSYRMRD